MLEPTVAYLVERVGMKRSTATIALGVVVWAVGILCLGSFNFMSDVTLFGKNVFDFLDYITANIMLPLGGIFIALFAGWVVKKKHASDEINLKSEGLFNLWLFVVKIIAPVAVGVVFILNL